MKKVLLLLITLLLAACSSQTTIDPEKPSDNETPQQATNYPIYECYYAQDTGYEEYGEYYYVIHADEKEADLVNKVEMMYNYHYPTALEKEVTDNFVASENEFYRDIKGIDFEVSAYPFLVQERIVYDYTEVDFQELVDRELLDLTTDGQVPSYISTELTVDGYQSIGMTCQEKKDDASSLKNRMLTPEFGVPGNEVHPDLPELKKTQAVGEQTLYCELFSEEYPDLKSWQRMVYNAQTDELLHNTIHDEYEITENADPAQIEKRISDLKALHENMEGATYEAQMDDKYLVEDYVYDYRVIDIADLMAAGLIQGSTDEPPTYMSYSFSVEGLEQMGYVCGGEQ